MLSALDRRRRACGFAGSIAFRRFRVRNEEHDLLAAERARLAGERASAWPGCAELLGTRRGIPPLHVRDVALRRREPDADAGARRVFDEVLHLPSFWQIAVTTAVPVLVIPFAIQPWAQLPRSASRHRLPLGARLGPVRPRRPCSWRRPRCAQPVLVWPGALLMGVSLAAGSLGLVARAQRLRAARRRNALHGAARDPDRRCGVCSRRRLRSPPITASRQLRPGPGAVVRSLSARWPLIVARRAGVHGAWTAAAQ